MSAHRWIRRLDGRVELWSGDVHLGAIKPTGAAWLVVLPEWARRVWIDNGATNPQRTTSSHEAKAAAKRALLRAVMAPRVKGRKAEAMGWRKDDCYCIDGVVVGSVEVSDLQDDWTWASIARADRTCGQRWEPPGRRHVRRT